MDRQQIKKEFQAERLWGHVKAFAIRRAQSKKFRKWLTIGAVIGVGVVLLFTAFFGVVDWFLTNLEHTPKEKQAEVGSVIARNMGLLIAAVIGLVFGIWRAYTAYRQTQASEIQARTAARGHFAERFAAAAEHLGHETLAVRLGGLYALEALGRDAEASDVVSIADVICTFVRTGPPKKEEKQGGAEGTQPPERSDENTGGQEEPSITEDIQVALDILTYEQTGTHRPTGLRERLPEGHHLNLQGANLSGANLGLANLSGADLYGANLSEANLGLANLSMANLRGANLRRANLSEANLNGVDLSGANLTGAYLNKGNLSGVELREANLDGANLSGADLSRAKNLSQEQLDSAALSVFDMPPRRLPEGLTPPTHKYERPW